MCLRPIAKLAPSLVPGADGVLYSQTATEAEREPDSFALQLAKVVGLSACAMGVIVMIVAHAL
jgi:hypothetical protein